MSRSFVLCSFSLTLAAFLWGGIATASAPNGPSSGQRFSEDQIEAIKSFNSAIPFINSADWSQATPRLKRAVELDPTRGEAWVGLGKCQAHLGHIEEAIADLQKGVKLRPDFPTAWIEMGSAYEGSGRLEEALAAYKEFETRFPKSEQARTVKDLIRDLSNELNAEKAAAATDKAAQAGTDYFVYATSKGTGHWTKDNMPLKVYIGSPEGKKDYRPSYNELLHKAFDRWQNSSDGRISFTFVDTAKESDIDVNWTDDIHKVASLAEHGETRSQITVSAIQHATINLLTVEDPNDQDKLTDNLMYGVCLHEIGHALGMRGHSNSPDDIMFYCVPTAEREFDLSARDIATMARLYDTQTMHNIIAISADGADVMGDVKAELNNEGVVLMQNGKLEEAIKKFEASIQRGTADNPARHNLSMALNNLAIQYCKASQYDKAEPLFKRSLELASDTDSQFKGDVLKNYIKLLTIEHRQGEAEKLQTAQTAQTTELGVRAQLKQK